MGDGARSSGAGAGQQSRGQAAADFQFVLRPDHRNVTKKEMLIELQQVAKRLKTRRLTGEAYHRHGRFGVKVVAHRFGSWRAALRAAGLEMSKMLGVSRASFLADVRRLARQRKGAGIGLGWYLAHGKYTIGVMHRHFPNWAIATSAAGVQPEKLLMVSEQVLMENLERVWRQLGRQPGHGDMFRPLSAHGTKPYDRCFGSFRKALEVFVQRMPASRAKGEGQTSPALGNPVSITPNQLPAASARPHEAPASLQVYASRFVGWRLRFLTLRRDGFCCRACGASPAIDRKVKLNVDHVIPWSRGGKTQLENLQTLCRTCNGGKSNLDWKVKNAHPRHRRKKLRPSGKPSNG